MAKQTENGKAFEYACIDFFTKSLSKKQNVTVVKNAPLDTAEELFNSLDNNTRDDLKSAAKAAYKVVNNLEPRIESYLTDFPLELTLQADAKGQAGDVRDVVLSRSEEDWEIGLSCKHNHQAIKHSRLSETIDFGKEWMSLPCSEQYFDEVRPIFAKLRKIKDESVRRGKPALWSDLEDKEGEYYEPVLSAFLKELSRLDKCYPNKVPERMVQYLLGRNDFYKIISDDATRTTRVEAFNINGTLGQSSKNQIARARIKRIKLPTRILKMEFIQGKKNKVQVFFDEGWTITFRIHNASSKIEPSLKFDVQLVSLPNSIYAQSEPWQF